MDQWLFAPSHSKLERPFSAEEIRRALFDMAPSKTPGIDGFNTGFFQQFWPIIGKGMTDACLSILNDHRPMSELNHTLVILIPQIDRAVKMGDFRPISLCNVSLKIVAKTLANRLRGVLGELISKTQSAFISGRAIFDNAIISFRCLHALKRKRKGKTSFMRVKLDIAKAYDRVEWVFLETMFRMMDFSPAWTSLVMDCVSSVRYSFLVNGDSIGLIHPSRGLHQGDSLSVYLFLFCAEGLSCLISKVESQGLFSSFRAVDGSCLVCHGCLESMAHALWSYTSLKVMRSAYCSWIQRPFDPGLFCVVVWRCWFRRNRAVDTLARAAITHGSDRFWFDFCPSCMELLVQEDTRG
ncbi:hypothetical protein ACOSQ4_003321 [Xanthoceras sorbifolium]